MRRLEALRTLGYIAGSPAIELDQVPASDEPRRVRPVARL